VDLIPPVDEATEDSHIPFRGYVVPGDLRKFAEQHGGVIGWDSSNRADILTHSVSGVDWSDYKHPLPQHVYDVYTRYWGAVVFKPRA